VKVGLVRADSGFCTHEIFSALAERGVPYLIAAKAYANLKNEVYGVKDWGKVCPGSTLNGQHQATPGTLRSYCLQ
jgi:hypothetical protein